MNYLDMTIPVWVILLGYALCLAVWGVVAWILTRARKGPRTWD